MKLFLLALASLFAFAVAAPAASYYVLHEKREVQHKKWTKRNVKINHDAVMLMSIGMAQRNLDNGYKFLMDVSDPESPNYGQHWSLDKV